MVYGATRQRLWHLHDLPSFRGSDTYVMCSPLPLAEKDTPYKIMDRERIMIDPNSRNFTPTKKGKRSDEDEPNCFSYDRIFPPTSSQKDVFDCVLNDSVTSVLQGNSCSNPGKLQRSRAREIFPTVQYSMKKCSPDCFQTRPSRYSEKSRKACMCTTACILQDRDSNSMHARA